MLVLTDNSTAQNTNTLAAREPMEFDGVQIQFQYEDCISQANGTAKQYLILSVVNNRSNNISISFRKKMWYDGKCISCESEGDEHQVTHEIEAGTVSSGSCTTNNGLRIFSRMLNLKNVSQLTYFDIDQISIQDVD